MNLFTKQVDDLYLRKNFEIIEEAFNALVFSRGDFEFFEFRIEGQQDEFRLYHNLGFNPNDVIVTKAIGSSFEFVYTGFTDTYLTIKTTGDLYLRCFVGNMKGDEVSGANAFANVTDDLGSSGGAGGGNLSFYPWSKVIDSATLTTRTIVLGHTPIENSEVVTLNGLLILDGYSLVQNKLTLDQSIDIELGDEVLIKYAA